MKKVLIVAINYVNTSHELHGCVTDGKNIKQFLQSTYKILDKDITFMCEDSPDPDLIPNKKNVIHQMNLLVQNNQKGSQHYLHYSGHGSYVQDLSGDESDVRDESIHLLDGNVTDDDLKKILVEPLSEGAQLFCIFDSCHSGSVLDLKYCYQFPKERPTYNIQIDKHYSDSKGDVVLLSGCRDEQTSADAFIEGVSQGAMTYSFLETVKVLKSAGQPFTLKNIMKHLVTFISEKGYKQIPQLSTGKYVNIDLPLKIF